jgi:hypothetical protein
MKTFLRRCTLWWMSRRFLRSIEYAYLATVFFCLLNKVPKKLRVLRNFEVPGVADNFLLRLSHIVRLICVSCPFPPGGTGFETVWDTWLGFHAGLPCCTRAMCRPQPQRCAYPSAPGLAWRQLVDKSFV